MIAIKTIHYEDTYILNICDAELLSTTLTDGRVSIYIDPLYYNGELIDEDEAQPYLQKAGILNLVGKRSIDMVIKGGLGNPEAIRIIDGVPFLIIYRFKYSGS